VLNYRIWQRVAINPKTCIPIIFKYIITKLGNKCNAYSKPELGAKLKYDYLITILS
jgi:hypothetical protein